MRKKTNRNKRVPVAVLCAAAMGIFSAGAVTPMWLRDVKISPDGSTIAFTYKGDIYTVPAEGGNATRLTTSGSYESVPVWSPDGSKIAFASDHHGSTDVFVMPVTGGTVKRLTSYSGVEIPEAFSADGKYVYFSAAIQDPAASAAFPSSRLTELYQVPAEGGGVTRVLSTPAQMPSVSPDGSFMLYQDNKGVENEWRKHHTSSVTRGLWRYDFKTGRHTPLVDHAGEDRNPVLSHDGKDMLFLSERDGGSMNVYSLPLDDITGTPKALTAFQDHPVRFLSQGSNGLIAMAYDGEIYTLEPGGETKKVAIEVLTDEYSAPSVINVTSGASEAVASPNGSMVAFVKRGNVFVTSVEYNTTKQVSFTPQAEKDLTWGSDNRSLYYTSDRSGRPNIYKAWMSRPDDPDFPNATVIEEKEMFPNDGKERFSPKVSPDGEKLAYIQDRDKLMIMDLNTKAVKQLTDGSLIKSRRGLEFNWSPDSRWIAFTAVGNGHDPYYDIAIVNADEYRPEVIMLTESAYFDEQPVWSPDGNAVLFISDRYGMRNQASWGSQSDVFAVFVNQEGLDRYRLNEEDYKLLTEQEKKEKKDKDAIIETRVEPQGIQDRLVRLTPYSSDVAGAVMNKDASKLYYLSKVEKGYDLWSIDLRKGSASIVNKLAAGTPPSLSLSGDASVLFMLSGSSMKKMTLPGEKISNISYSARMPLDRAAEREYMLEFVRNQEKENFYVKDMHGVEWDSLVDHYGRFLPHINNNHDYSEMLSELLGELNVSHTGSGYRSGSADEATADLGAIFDFTYTGHGLKIDEIVTGGPLDRATSRVRAGDIITEINGHEITPDTDFSVLLNGLANHKTLLNVRSSATGAVFQEVVKPISRAAMNDLLYRRWVAQLAAQVDSLSNGRLGYVHIESMDNDSFRRIYADILGKYNQREGIVIDTRWNGGGRMHEDIEILFSGEKYLTQVVRDEEVCDMPSRRWNKPSIMIQGEANYSNAHGTPWVYKHRGIGKLVGMPVPGTMTSVNWVTLQDPSMYFGIPIIGYRLPDGSYLENKQLEPDIRVANTPERLAAGIDDQLITAVNELLKEIDSKKQ